MASNIDESNCLVDENEAGSRLDRFLLRRLNGIDRSLVLRLIRKGNVRVNGKRMKPEGRLNLGDTIFLPLSLRSGEPSSTKRAQEEHTIPQHILNSIERLYEDDDLLILNKPEGVVVHGGSGHDAGLIESLKKQLGLDELRLAHRLDRDTSGCLLLAKNLLTLRELTADFRVRDVQKTYLAWVEGHPYPYAARITSHLSKGVVRGGERMVVSNDEGQESVTDYQVILLAEKEGLDYAMVALTPHSGRTHQLRVQMQVQGHAILADGKYATQEAQKSAKKVLGCKALALHAWRLKIKHPRTGALLDVRAPFPKRWQKSFANVGYELCAEAHF
ncbi:MAG: RluA family pseudouridine synthase [Zetaproteobacteria bacterium]|nr:RluA family pseudouridine synthase [Zetaproteobacteria bacterium]